MMHIKTRVLNNKAAGVYESRVITAIQSGIITTNVFPLSGFLNWSISEYPLKNS